MTPLFADTDSLRNALPIVLGLASVFMLLPRPRAMTKWLGVALGIAALFTAAAMLLPEVAEAGWAEAFLFYAFSGMAIIGGVLLVTQPNPARGAVAFALVVLNVCGLFLLKGAPFLMAGTIIIYAGAIVVTFLFVIMLDFQLAPTDADSRVREPLLACFTGGLLMALLITTSRQHFDTRGVDQVIAAIDAALNSATVGKVKTADITESINRLGMHTPFKSRLAELDEQFDMRISRAATPDEAKAELRKLRAAVYMVRHQVGDIPPPANVPLSGFGGLRGTDSLPAGNVAAIGRVLFSDYLLAVELGGTLLLVATIGAIAITHRATRRVTP